MKACDYVSYLNIILYAIASILYSVIKPIYKCNRES